MPTGALWESTGEGEAGAVQRTARQADVTEIVCDIAVRSHFVSTSNLLHAWKHTFTINLIDSRKTPAHLENMLDSAAGSFPQPRAPAERNPSPATEKQ